MNQKDKISVIIIAKNEAVRIKECIEQFSWACEVIVIDNGSTDTTADIAKKCNAIVVSHPGKNFSDLRDIGATYAKGTWLLYIDADEKISPEFHKEIIGKISGIPVAYFVFRRNYYLGSLWPTKDKMIRLIRKDALKSWQGPLHEHPDIKGTIGYIDEPLTHITHRTLSEMVEKTNEWSEIEADLRFSKHHPKLSWWRFLRVMVTAFYDSFVKQQGWKVGTVGWVESIYQAFSMFITYAKLWERQQQSNEK